MKISNETKVGIVTAFAITFFILGFNFLKGKSLFKTGNFLNAQFTDTKGLQVSNQVLVNGYQVGSVYEIENTDASLKNIHVVIKLKQAYDIPDNSIAIINSNPLGSSSIEIKLGDSKTFLANDATVKTVNDAGLIASITQKITPVADQIKATTASLDSVLKNINSTLDGSAKNNLQAVIANLNKLTASLAISSASIQQMLNQQSGSIAASMNNVNAFTKNLADNNEKVTGIMNNLQTTTAKLSKADIEGSINSLKKSIENLNGILDKANSKEGSLGLLMNDKTLYNQLTNTVRSANILLDDLKVHPKRYVNISVFGKKDKSVPLDAPLADSTKKP